MQIDILVEEPSAEEALRHLLPKLPVGQARAQIINMRSKHRLLKVLPARLKAYEARIERGENLRVVVLVDRDRDDCIALKRKLEMFARQAKLKTCSSAKMGSFVVLNRIVVEELESWFIGDAAALRRAFPSLPTINLNKRPFHNPDNGGTWEELHRFLKKQGIYKSSYPKIDAARRIAPHMTIDRNRSKSFNVFVSGIKSLLSLQ